MEPTANRQTITVAWAPEAIERALEHASAVTRLADGPDDQYRINGQTITWMDFAALVDATRAVLAHQTEIERLNAELRDALRTINDHRARIDNVAAAAQRYRRERDERLTLKESSTLAKQRDEARATVLDVSRMLRLSDRPDCLERHVITNELRNTLNRLDQWRSGTRITVETSNQQDRLIEAEEELAAARQDLKDLRAELNEARSWARHGYEIGQRSATWSDEGVAPKWLTEGHNPAALVAPESETVDQRVSAVQNQIGWAFNRLEDVERALSTAGLMPVDKEATANG